MVLIAMVPFIHGLITDAIEIPLPGNGEGGGKMKIRMTFFISLMYCILWAPVAIAAPETDKEKPIDPFDYNFCGGERVYPIVGVNISTACGPRNQFALGRRGKLMWFFPGGESRKEYKGSIKLTDEQLAELSILAEVAKVADSREPVPGKLIYKMGINFSARQPKYIYTNYSDSYTPSNELLRSIMRLVPESEKPFFPDCGPTLTIFDPTLHQHERKNKITKQLAGE